MLRAVRDMHHFTIGAIDGEIGEVKDVYFDDESWAIRYVAVDTRKWLPGKQILVSPEWIDGVSRTGNYMHHRPRRRTA